MRHVELFEYTRGAVPEYYPTGNGDEFQRLFRRLCRFDTLPKNDVEPRVHLHLERLFGEMGRSVRTPLHRARRSKQWGPCLIQAECFWERP